jgi:hypothetical protein
MGIDTFSRPGLFVKQLRPAHASGPMSGRSQRFVESVGIC